jgi:hypothetical protein
MKRRTPAVAVAAALLAPALLAGCGDDTGQGTVPKGWGKLETEYVSVAFPRDEGFEKQRQGQLGKHVDAGARRVEDGVRTGAVTVLSGYATNIQDPAGAASWIAAGVELGGERKKTEDVEVSGPEGSRTMRRIDFETESTGDDKSPQEGTKIEGVILGGLDSQDEGFAIRIDAVKGSLSNGDLEKIIDSVTVR